MKTNTNQKYIFGFLFLIILTLIFHLKASGYVGSFDASGDANIFFRAKLAMLSIIYPIYIIVWSSRIEKENLLAKKLALKSTASSVAGIRLFAKIWLVMGVLYFGVANWFM